MTFLPFLMSLVVAAVVSNTVLRRIALVPMQSYPYFLTQCQILMYVFAYSAILYHRYRRGDGTVTIEMLRIPKRPFLWIGLWDAVGDLLGNIGTSKLPGYQAPMLAKLNIIFSAIFSRLILQKRYTWSQLGAMAIVLCGAVVSFWPTIRHELLNGGNENEAIDTDEGTPVSLFYTLVYIASVAPTALAFVLKEEIFQKHRHLDLDVFVVMSYGSIVGLAVSMMLMPLASVPGLGGKEAIPLSELPEYMGRGSECFRGINPTLGDDCRGAPLAPALYLGVNVMMNISLLLLVKHGGALLGFLTTSVTFPLSTILFVLPWPLLGSSTLNIFVIIGLAIELTGIILYQHASSSAKRRDRHADLPGLSLHLARSSEGEHSYGSVNDHSGEDGIHI
ncbi:hypothetical protein ACHAWF_013575 [Thalassiosira exigua]